MAREKIRVGIIGANVRNGWGRDAHIPALSALPEFEIAAVCTSRQETADETARHFEIPPLCRPLQNGPACRRGPRLDLRAGALSPSAGNGKSTARQSSVLEGLRQHVVRGLPGRLKSRITPWLQAHRPRVSDRHRQHHRHQSDARANARL